MLVPLCTWAVCNAQWSCDAACRPIPSAFACLPHSQKHTHVTSSLLSAGFWATMTATATSPTSAFPMTLRTASTTSCAASLRCLAVWWVLPAGSFRAHPTANRSTSPPRLSVSVSLSSSSPLPPLFACAPLFLQLIPLVFSIARKFGCTNKGAVLAACLVNFDMLNLTESRLILMDAQASAPHTCTRDPDPAPNPFRLLLHDVNP